MRKKIDFLIVIMILLLLFCVPNSISFGVLTQPKFLGIFFFAILLYLFITKRITFNNLKKKCFENYFLLGLIVFSFIILLSVVINKSISITNIFEIIRPIIYAISLLVLTGLFNDEGNQNVFSKTVSVLILLLFVANVVQFYNFGNINDLYIRAVAPTQYSTLVDSYPWPRIVGFIGNPNEYGYILSIINLYLIYRLFKNKKQKNNIFIIFLILINKFGLFLTGSRTAYLSLIASELCFIFFMCYFSKKDKFINRLKKPVLLTLCVVILESAILFVTPLKYNWRVREIFSGTISSWEKRKKSTKEIIDNLLEDNSSLNLADDNSSFDDDSDNDEPDINDIDKNDMIREYRLKDKILRLLIGKGPIKNGFAFDNEWVHIFVVFGVLGLISYVSIYLLSFLGLKGLTTTFKCYYFAILLLNIIYMVAAGTYFSYTLFISFILFITYVYVREKYEKK